MKKEIKYIWVVETKNTFEFSNGNVKTNSVLHSYFSSKEKAIVHIEWVKACALNNKAVLVFEDDNYTTYKLTNGENWVIRLYREVIDADDDLIGQA